MSDIEKAAEAAFADNQIKHMVDRFLQWRLPENFNPDGGISFDKMRNENTPWPAKNEPVGTNLFDAIQAEEMVKYIIEGMPVRAAKPFLQEQPQWKFALKLMI